MADDERDEAPAERPRPTRRPRTEKGLGLEVARLFGMDPRLLVAPRSRPAEDLDAPGSADVGDEAGREEHPASGA